MTGGRTFTNVNKHLAKARARIRLARLRGTRACREAGRDRASHDGGGQLRPDRLFKSEMTNRAEHSEGSPT